MGETLQPEAMVRPVPPKWRLQRRRTSKAQTITGAKSNKNNNNSNNKIGDGDADADDDVIMSGQFSNAGDVVGSNFVIINARAHAHDLNVVVVSVAALEQV